MEILKALFVSQGLNPMDAQKVAENFSLKKIRKGDFFIQEGKISKHLGYIEKGYLQHFITLDGIEKTSYSIGANSFAASLNSFLKGIPARENIRALIDTEIWLIKKAALNKLADEIPAFKAFYIGLLEWQICCIDESRLDYILLSPQERYLKMIEKEPAILHNLPLQQVASILGITPRHLSRIRNNIR